MIDLKSAVRIASEELGSLYPPEVLRDVLLEEVEKSDDGRFWLVTLGFTRPLPQIGVSDVFKALTAKDVKREYKIFEIDGDTGTLRSMRMRTV